jgi:hypothetical protein
MVAWARKRDASALLGMLVVLAGGLPESVESLPPPQATSAASMAEANATRVNRATRAPSDF